MVDGVSRCQSRLAGKVFGALGLAAGMFLLQPSASGDAWAQGINPVAIVDERMDKLFTGLRDLIAHGERTGNALIVAWAKQMLVLLERLNESLTEQQKIFWMNAGEQREKVFSDIERTIDDAKRSGDVALERIDVMKGEFEDTIIRAMRASTEPFVSGHWPTYIVPTGQDVLLVVKGKYVKDATVKLDDGTNLERSNATETQAAFRLPKEKIKPGKELGMVGFTLEFPKQGGVFSGVPNYKMMSVLLPERAGSVNVSAIVEVVREATRTKYDPPLGRDPYFLRSPKEGESDQSQPYCVNPDYGFVFSTNSSDIEFETNTGSPRGSRKSGANKWVGTDGRLCSQGWVSPDGGYNAGVHWRVKGLMIKRYREEIDQTVEINKPLYWHKEAPVLLPMGNKGWQASIKFFDDRELVAHRPDLYRFLKIVATGNRLRLAIDLPSSNLGNPPLR